MDGSSDIECLVNDSSVVFMQFVRSGGRVVQATDKYGSSRFSNESMQFCVAVVSLVADWFRRQTNLRLSVWLTIAVLR